MTKPDESRHPDLSPPQAAALELLAAGKNDTETANEVGVTRQTVNTWRHHDPVFIAALNARRRELWGDVQDRLRSLALRAVDTLDGALDGPQGVPAAVHILKAVGVYGGAGDPSWPTTPEGVIRRMSDEIARDVMQGDRPMDTLAELTLRDGRRTDLSQGIYDELVARTKPAKRKKTA